MIEKIRTCLLGAGETELTDTEFRGKMVVSLHLGLIDTGTFEV